MNEERKTGSWILLVGGFLLLVMLLAGQMMSFIDYDFTVSVGLQESRDILGERGVAMNKGFGVGDTIVYTPLMILGLWGLLFRKRLGLFAMFGAMAITAYWPMVCLFILVYSKGGPGFHFTDYRLYSIVLSLITVFGFWGQWYLYKELKGVSNQG